MNFKIIFVVIFLCFLKSALSQPGKLSLEDSLISELNKVQEDSNRQKLYNDIGNVFLDKKGNKKSDIDNGFYYLRKSVYMIDSANLQNVEITNHGLLLLAATYIKAGKASIGKKICQQVIKSYHQTNNKEKEALSWNWLAIFLDKYGGSKEEVEVFFERASAMYADLKEYHKVIDIGYSVGFSYFRRGKQELSEKKIASVIQVCRENNNYGLTALLFLAAWQKRYTGQLNQALNYAMEIQKIVEETNDTLNENHIYGELALEYEEMNDPEKSIYWYKKCIDERVELGFDPYIIYRTAYFMIVQMIKVNREREGLHILLNLKKTVPRVRPVENAVLSQSLAYCYNAMGQRENAEQYFLSMIKIYDKEEAGGEAYFIANFDIGKFYITQQEFGKADPFVKKAFDNRNLSPVSRIKDLYLLMFKVDSAAGKYVSAIKYFQQYKMLNDSLFNEAKSKQIEELNVKYEVEKKEQNLTILQKENILQQKDLKQERITRNLILVGVLLLLVFAGLLYNRYQFKQQANKQLQASQQKIEKQNVSLQHLVSEKEWLLKEIHHRVKNNLHTISGLLDAQASYLQTKEALTAINDSQHRVQAMSLLHQKLFNSESLSNVQMPEYIHELIGYLEHSFGTQPAVKFIVEVDNLELGLSCALPIGLILNEAITNAIKYAFPERQEGTISIQLKHQVQNQYLLVIADDGKGLPANFSPQQSHSMGMSLIQGLSEDINGVFSISNNNGTEINIQFACDPASEYHAAFKSTSS
jgi:two-component sensor histidine kinase